MGDIVFHFFPHLRQHLTEFVKPMKFGLVPYSVPVGMILILLPVLYIVTGHLDMPVDIRTNPNTRPRWWNNQFFNSEKDILILYRNAIQRIAIARALFFAHDAWVGIGNIFQARDCSCALIVPMHFNGLNSGYTHC